MERLNRSSLPRYVQGIQAYLDADLKTLDRILKSQSLCETQKKLLRVRKYLRQKSWTSALETVHSIINQSSEPFFQGEAWMLSATSHTHLGQFELSALANHKAHHCYLDARDRRGAFLSAFNLAVDYNRLGLEDLSFSFLQRAQQWAESPSERCLCLRQAACHYSRLRNYSESEKFLKLALSLEKDLSDLDRKSLWSISTDLNVRFGRFDQAVENLEKLSSDKTLRESAKFGFERAWIGFLSKSHQDLSFPRKPARIEDSVEYSTKWKLLQALSQGDKKLAAKCWHELRVMFPAIFSDSFEFQLKSEHDSLLGRAMAFFLKSYVSQSQQDVQAENPKSDLVFKLQKLLEQNPAPSCKEELIEGLWTVPYDPSFDSRFYKLVQRLKARLPQGRLLVRNRAYQWIRSSN